MRTVTLLSKVGSHTGLIGVDQHRDECISSYTSNSTTFIYGAGQIVKTGDSFLRITVEITRRDCLMPMQTMDENNTECLVVVSQAVIGDRSYVTDDCALLVVDQHRIIVTDRTHYRYTRQLRRRQGGYNSQIPKYAVGILGTGHYCVMGNDSISIK